jgi:hypothetical protein
MKEIVASLAFALEMLYIESEVKSPRSARFACNFS